MEQENKKLEDILSIIPKIKDERPGREADYYGISNLIAAKLKLPFIPRCLSGWKHGWLFSDLKYVEQLTAGVPNDKYLVPLKEHEQFLEQNGIKAKAVGMPFMYGEDFDTKEITRQKNTLLVMPPHSLSYTNHTWDEEGYVRQINEIKDQFDLVAVCIHQSCEKKGLWINTFKKHNIPCIIGAEVTDKNALIRMSRLFKSFEFMTTNTVGSHVLYASYCGCKVSIYGNFAEYTKEDHKNDLNYIKFPFLLDQYLKCSTKKYIQDKFPHLFVNHPKEAKVNVDWAAEQIGIENKTTWKELGKLLGWTFKDQMIFYSKKIIQKIKKQFNKHLDT